MATWPHGPAQVRCHTSPVATAASLKPVSLKGRKTMRNVTVPGLLLQWSLGKQQANFNISWVTSLGCHLEPCEKNTRFLGCFSSCPAALMRPDLTTGLGLLKSQGQGLEGSALRVCSCVATLPRRELFPLSPTKTKNIFLSHHPNLT